MVVENENSTFAEASTKGWNADLDETALAVLGLWCTMRADPGAVILWMGASV